MDVFMKKTIIIVLVFIPILFLSGCTTLTSSDTIYNRDSITINSDPLYSTRVDYVGYGLGGQGLGGYGMGGYGLSGYAGQWREL